jgi:hypothetical protein
LLIPNKSEYLKLAKENKAGNTLQTWYCHTEIPKMFTGNLTIRNKEKDSPFFIPNVPIKNLNTILTKLIKKGLNLSTAYFQEVPHKITCLNLKCEGCGRILNGEAMRSEEFMYLTYGVSENLNLRSDINLNGKVATGLQSVLYLKSKHDAYQKLNELWDEYPHAIIEFSVFDRKVGNLNSNTLIWEIRDY